MSKPSQPALSVLDGVMLVVGIVVGTSILRVPASIAQQTTGPAQLLSALLLGGGFAACGAFCYARLAREHPGNGGEYHYLHWCYGEPVSFLFVWARTAVLQTGSIAATAFVYGDYAARLLPLGEQGVMLHALCAIIVLTVVNALGLRLGKCSQNLLTAAKVTGLLLIVVAGFCATRVGAQLAPASATASTVPAFGLAMVFVLYAYGGWNEASYIAGDVRGGPRGLASVLWFSIAAVAVIYVVIHLAYLRGLGFAGLRLSSAPAADVVSLAFGREAEVVIAALAAIIALGTVNATIFTGSRALEAAGANHLSARWLSHVRRPSGAPIGAFALQGLVAAAFVACASVLGSDGRQGFEVAVEYTAPAFWGFMTLIAIVVVTRSVRGKDSSASRIGFLLSAALFLAMNLYMLHSSITYAGRGALLSLGVVLAGVPTYLLIRRMDRRVHRVLASADARSADPAAPE